MTAEPIPPSRLRPAITLVGVALLALAVLGLGRGLWTPDEPREAEIGREMYLSPGVIPTLGGVPFIEKPPLYYWVVAGVFRAAGGPSVAAARAVSVAAGLATLVIVALWGRRARSWSVGLLATVMLATSLQFLNSTHWVLIDPLLMALCAAAAWAAWELVSGEGGRGALFVFYLALVLAMWTKGLIGPALLASGLIAFAVVDRGARPWRALAPALGLVVLLAAVGSVAGAIYLEGGRHALWEWAWVNHVQRFFDPAGTGHRQPVYYYLKALPVAVLPWLVPLVDVCRPARWRKAGEEARLEVFCGSLAVGMFVLLSAASTKREVYLLPMLPPLALLLAVDVAQWWERNAGARRSSPAWWTQFGLTATVALAPAAGVTVYTRHADVLSVVSLVVVGVLLGLAAATIARPSGLLGPAAFLAATVLGSASLVVLVPRALEPEKNMAPAAREISALLPAGQAVPAVGVDETLRGIIPFVTGRHVEAVAKKDLSAARGGRLPGWVLVQFDKDRPEEGKLSAPYVLERSWTFGVSRSWSLWKRKDGW
jgi:4-amino-4-deoxy-L-arabinose transferase-like glycosyltransferase